MDGSTNVTMEGSGETFRVIRSAKSLIKACLLAVFGVLFLVIFAGVFVNLMDRQVNWQALTSTEIMFVILISAMFLFVLFGLFLEVSWNINGLEIIEISPAGVLLIHDLYGFQVKRKVKMNDVRAIHVRKEDAIFSYKQSRRPLSFYSFLRGKVAVDLERPGLFGPGTLWIGSRMNDREAASTVAKVHEKFPELR